MKTTTAVVAVLVTSGLGHLACCEDIEPPLRVVDGLFEITNKKSLGLETIASERVEVFQASERAGHYSHHPGLAVFKGHLYCSWSNGKEGREDYPGQRVLYARSADGTDWSQPQVLVEPDGKQDCLVAAGFHVAADALVAYHTVKRGPPEEHLHRSDICLVCPHVDRRKALEQASKSHRGHLYGRTPSAPRWEALAGRRTLGRSSQNRARKNAAALFG